MQATYVSTPVALPHLRHAKPRRAVADNLSNWSLRSVILRV